MGIVGGNILLTVAAVIYWVIQIYIYIIIARALVSWVQPNPYNPIVQFLYKVTEPVLGRIRRRLPIRGLALDLSPLIAILILWVLQFFMVKTLQDLAMRYKI